MKFSTDYMKLAMLLDSGLLERIETVQSNELLKDDMNKAKRIKAILDPMLESRGEWRAPLIRLMNQVVQFSTGIRGAVFTRLLGYRMNEAAHAQNKIDRLTALGMLSSELDFDCDLKKLQGHINSFILEAEKVAASNSILKDMAGGGE
ncbi:MAG: hypothetical protein U9R28_04050 [Pseudomonadota bacterium]|nr:hypothetical protein [Pseudomonadota bacterium]